MVVFSTFFLLFGSCLNTSTYPNIRFSTRANQCSGLLRSGILGLKEFTIEHFRQYRAHHVIPKSGDSKRTRRNLNEILLEINTLNEESEVGFGSETMELIAAAAYMYQELDFDKESKH